MNLLLLRRSSISKLKANAVFQGSRNHVTTTITRIRPRNHACSSRIRIRSDYESPSPLVESISASQFFSVASSVDDEDENIPKRNDRSLLFSPLSDSASPAETAAPTPHAVTDSIPAADTTAETVVSESSLLFGATPSQNDGSDEDSTDEEYDEDTEVTGPMFANGNNPMWNLKSYYLNNNGIKISGYHFKDSNKVYEVDDHILCCWTSTFRCPVTKTKYTSGTLREYFAPLQGIGKDDKNSDENKLIYYSKKSHSRSAVAGKVLDAIQFEKAGLIEPRFCNEDPSQPAQNVVLTRETAMEESDNDLLSAGSLKAKLRKHYKDQYGVAVTKSSLQQKRITFVNAKLKAKKAWTSTFKCPVTGTLYPAGRLRKTLTIVKEPMEGDQIFYYAPGECALASLARVLDVVQYQKDGVTEPRFCEEDPSLFKVQHPVGSTPDTDKSNKTEPKDYVVTKLPSPEKSPAENLLFAHIGTSAEETEQLEESNLSDFESASTLFGDSSADIKEEEEEEEESNFVVTNIPVNVGRSPSQRLLEAASSLGSAAPPSANKEERVSSVFTGEQTKLVPLSVRSGSEAQMAIQAARHWIEAHSGSLAKHLSRIAGVHRLHIAQENSSSILLVAKTILSALAAANQALPVGNRQGIEGIASQVLNILWEFENSKPDADAYAFYLKCLDGDPKLSRARAEEIVHAMKSGMPDKKSGRILPKPNQNTINSLIQVSAQVGGTSGRYTKYTDDDFRPGRESFLAVLSSAAYRPMEEFESGGFDIDFAQECIQRMSEIAEETGDASLQPDTQVYNAPLRWAGGQRLWADSRPYARFLPWDSYQSLFRKGLRKNVMEDDLRYKEANAMERWLNQMEEQSATNESVAPNIETYEAVIQGWLRTVTREGLERAESIVQRLLPESSAIERSCSISSALRLQTFHPKLASWYHSGEPDGPSKILEWIGKLEKIGDAGLSELIVDSRILELKMALLLKEQEGMLEKLETLDSLEQDNRILAAATECSRVLKNACTRLEKNIENGENSGQMVDVILFTLSAMAWENVGSMGSVVNDSRLHRHAVEELLLSAELFERTLRMVVASETVKGVTLRKQEMSMQLEHMVVNAHYYFYGLVESMTRLQQKQQLCGAEARDLRIRSHLLIEKLTHAVVEFEEIEAHYLPSQSAKLKRISYEDQFSYDIKVNTSFVSSRSAFLWQVIKYLEESLDEGVNSDVIRLCTFLKHAALANQMIRPHGAIDKILNRVMPISLQLEQQKQSDDLDPNSAGNKKSSGGMSPPFRSISKSRRNLKGNHPHPQASKGAESDGDGEKTSEGSAQKLIERESKLSKPASASQTKTISGTI